MGARDKQRLARYSLVGPQGVLARESGLAGGRWFRGEVPRRRMKELMRREDGPAIRDTVRWLGIMAVAGSLGALAWVAGGGWALLAVPCFLIYGVLYGSGGDSRWHEGGHGTAFRTRWLGGIVYQLGSFMMMRDPTVFRWGHTRHHTDTLIVGRDPEIQAMRPIRLIKVVANFFGLYDVPVALWHLVLHAVGRLDPEEATFVPEQERPTVYRTARIWLTIYLATIATAVLAGSPLPVLFIGGPRLYGTFMHVVYGLTQHAGLGENVLDHRLNTRTVRMCRINRFIYWNMNYHVEHHMFPMVPYHGSPNSTRRSGTTWRRCTPRSRLPTGSSSRPCCASCATRATTSAANCPKARLRSTRATRLSPTDHHRDTSSRGAHRVGAGLQG